MRRGPTTAKDLIQIVTEISQENIQQLNKFISKMSEKQLHWNPNPGVWSIAEVLAHLNSYATYYHPVFRKKIETTRFQAVKEDFVSSPLGRSAWKSMKLGNAKNIKRKFKAPKGHNPTIDKELVDENVVANFAKAQEELIEIAEMSKEVNLKKVKIPISISKIVRLRLGDALLFVAYHNERHMQQIINLRTHPNFPKK